MYLDFIKKISLILFIAVSASFGFAKDYQEGRHYQLIEPLPTRDSEKIEVIEFFWFGCGHCFSLEACLLYTSPSPRDLSTSRMPSSA